MELLRTHEPLEAFVFDMDGTLLDSLPDLVDVTNETLTHFGYPTHTTEEILATACARLFCKRCRKT